MIEMFPFDIETTMSFLAQHALTYAPVVNEKRVPVATRISISPDRDGHLSTAQAYEAIAGQWNPDGGPLLLDLDARSPDAHLLELSPREDLWFEVPADFVTDPAGAELVIDLHIKGFQMAMRGRPVEDLTPDLLEAFRMSLVPYADDRRQAEGLAPPSDKRKIPSALTGVKSITQMETAFKEGATAVVGWPFDDVTERAEGASANPSFGVVAKLIQMIGAEADPGEMEKEVRRDPALAFRLFRYLNSPAFGLRVEIQSFQHALMMLGYKRLRKWLALLMATAARDKNLQPVMFASLRRGFLIERLNKDNPDTQLRDEAFIMGVFSLLDKLFNEPFESLFERLPMPEAVYDALVKSEGPLFPYLGLAGAIERTNERSVSESLGDVFISQEDCNIALLQALNESGVTTASAG
ncbi:MAG: HDOD domain-containing protein [Burkholderiaceae bacterium]